MEVEKRPKPEGAAAPRRDREREDRGPRGRQGRRGRDVRSHHGEANLQGLARRREGRRVQARTRSRSTRAWSCSTCCTGSRRDAGERPRAALELQGRQVRLVQHGDQRQAAARVHDAHEQLRPTTRRSPCQPLKTFPVIKDLVTDVSWNYEQNKRIPPFKPRPRDADGTLPDVPGGRRSRAGVPQVHRVLPVPGRLPRDPRPRREGQRSSARAS